MEVGRTECKVEMREVSVVDMHGVGRLIYRGVSEE